MTARQRVYRHCMNLIGGQQPCGEVMEKTRGMPFSDFSAGHSPTNRDGEMTEENKSEFGAGLTYCIGLFLAHAERKLSNSIDEKGAVEMWFNGAADHLFDLQVPEKPILPKDLRDEITEWQRKCLEWRLLWSPDVVPATKEDKQWAIDKAKEFLRRIDDGFGIPTIKGEWE